MSKSDNLVVRTMARIRHFLGVQSSADIGDSKPTEPETIHYGMYTRDEMRHISGIFDLKNPEAKKKQLDEEAISSYLTDIASDTRRKIDEIKNLKLMAPEIIQAKSVIVSSIISPQDLQTDVINVTVDHQGLSESLNADISAYLTKFFNTQYPLGPKLVSWLGCAGFEEGAKALLVLPRHVIDVLNVVADDWNDEYKATMNELRRNVRKSTEAFCTDILASECIVDVEAEVIADLESKHIGSEFISVEAKKSEKTSKSSKPEKLHTSSELAKEMVNKSFKLLKMNDDGNGVVVTRDMSAFGANARKVDDRIKELQAEAEKQIRGYSSADADSTNRPAFPVLTLDDVMKTADHDMPIVIELPTDSVIPVCAPRDNKNHIGYFVLLDENGQPARGMYAFNGTNPDATNRLATTAATAVFGNQTVQTFMSAGLTAGQAIDQMTSIFSVAVNHLLESKLHKDGLTGLDVNIHEAVGKALFFNLLAKNKIKMVFVPATMLIYYRFDHRENGTGKTFLEDISLILALRTTLTIAKIMAAIDNATKHRRIEVNVDEKNVNPLETMELVRRQFLAKKAPVITTDPQTAAEGILSQHLTIVPKAVPGTTEDLSVNTETQYGQSQAPDNEMMETLNNWLGIGLKLPPSVLNQLSEAEYSRSVATSNLFFANAVREWQNVIRPYNQKFIVNYILADNEILDELRKMIKSDFTEKNSSTKKEVKEARDANPKEINEDDDQKVESALKRVVATATLNLPPPAMATNKAHFEEIQAQIEAVARMLEVLYPDDIAPSDDLKSLMVSLRAMIASKTFREFLPKLGFHEIASVPEVDEIDTDRSTNLILFLNNLKRRAENITKMITGQLPDQQGGGDDAGGMGGGEGGESDAGGTDEGGESGGDEGGGEDDMSGGDMGF